MTTRTLALFSLLALAVSASAQTTGKTFFKSFNTDDVGRIVLDLPGSIDLKIWDSPTLRIEISVSLPDGSNSAMLNELANVGRYNLVAKTEGESLTISAPNLQKQVKVKGQELKETLSFVVYMPKSLEVEMRNAEAMADKNK